MLRYTYIACLYNRVSVFTARYKLSLHVYFRWMFKGLAASRPGMMREADHSNPSCAEFNARISTSIPLPPTQSQLYRFRRAVVFKLSISAEPLALNPNFRGIPAKLNCVFGVQKWKEIFKIKSFHLKGNNAYLWTKLYYWWYKLKIISAPVVYKTKRGK